jgi:hypothetical protein
MLLVFAGKNQVAIGVVPINFEGKSSESSLSVYPIAIGNCKEKRLVQPLCISELFCVQALTDNNRHYTHLFTFVLTLYKISFYLFLLLF